MLLSISFKLFIFEYFIHWLIGVFLLLDDWWEHIYFINLSLAVNCGLRLNNYWLVFSLSLLVMRNHIAFVVKFEGMVIQMKYRGRSKLLSLRALHLLLSSHLFLLDTFSLFEISRDITGLLFGCIICLLPLGHILYILTLFDNFYNACLPGIIMNSSGWLIKMQILSIEEMVVTAPYELLETGHVICYQYFSLEYWISFRYFLDFFWRS